MADVSSGLAPTTPKAKGKISKGKSFHQNQGLKLRKNEGKRVLSKVQSCALSFNGTDLIKNSLSKVSVATWKMAFAGSLKGGPRCPCDSSGVKQGIQHGWEFSPRPKCDDFKAGNRKFTQHKGEVSLWHVRWHLIRSLRGRYFMALGSMKRPSRRLYRISKLCSRLWELMQNTSGFFGRGRKTSTGAYSPILNTSGKIGLASIYLCFLITLCALTSLKGFNPGKKFSGRYPERNRGSASKRKQCR